MNQISTQQTSNIGTYFLGVVNSLLLGILGIQIVLVLIPVHTGDKRFNQ
ncbi:hypothetical protein [Mucilaginibacter sp.]|nr:hypothetical protein [Mucilaginibacter sp.]